MMQNLENRRSVKKCAQNTGSNVLNELLYELKSYGLAGNIIARIEHDLKYQIC